MSRPHFIAVMFILHHGSAILIPNIDLIDIGLSRHSSCSPWNCHWGIVPLRSQKYLPYLLCTMRTCKLLSKASCFSLRSCQQRDIPSSTIISWLVVYLPWKMMDFVSWGDDIPSWMESHNPVMFQTTNQSDDLPSSSPGFPSAPGAGAAPLPSSPPPGQRSSGAAPRGKWPSFRAKNHH